MYISKSLGAITKHMCKIMHKEKNFKKYNHFCYVHTFRKRNSVKGLLGHSTPSLAGLGYISQKTEATDVKFLNFLPSSCPLNLSTNAHI